ncbi:MAG: hypothetical protein JO211_05900 [Acidobacteriaceae bacterium]|nr:hypothetical protein [Acidobacteriaceae bacterium]
MIVLRYLFVAAALVAACYSALFGYAAFLFQEDTAASVAEAVRLVPFNSAYVARLANWQPERKLALLHRAVELNPFDFQSWIELGLSAEVEQHDVAAAERYYLRAAAVDHMFLPKWTLTNFYFRQQKPDEFFHWAQATLAITPYRADPVFTQMWLMRQDAERNAAALPDRSNVLLEYASFLANAHQYRAVPPIIQRLVAVAGSRNPAAFGRDDQIGPIEDRILQAGDLAAALAIWQTMHAAKWIDLPAPSAARPLTNGNFAAPFLRHGFDWTPVPQEGVTVDSSAIRKSVRITLSGGQPEHGILLQQYVPLDPNGHYRLRWRVESEDIHAPSGLAWHLYPVPQVSDSSLTAGDLLSPSEAEWQFASSNRDLYLLALEYARPLGSVRAIGSLSLESVYLDPQ